MIPAVSAVQPRGVDLRRAYRLILGACGHRCRRCDCEWRRDSRSVSAHLGSSVRAKRGRRVARAAVTGASSRKVGVDGRFSSTDAGGPVRSGLPASASRGQGHQSSAPRGSAPRGPGIGGREIGVPHLGVRRVRARDTGRRTSGSARRSSGRRSELGASGLGSLRGDSARRWSRRGRLLGVHHGPWRVQRRRRVDRSVTDDLADEVFEQLVWCGMRVECVRATRVMHRLAIAAQCGRGLRVPIDSRTRSDLVIRGAPVATAGGPPRPRVRVRRVAGTDRRAAAAARPSGRGSPPARVGRSTGSRARRVGRSQECQTRSWLRRSD